MITKRMIYDELCALLTDYENQQDPEVAKVGVADLYEMLAKIQNYWEEVITAK